MDSAAWTAFFTDMDRIAEGKMPNGENIYVDEEGVHWGGILLFSQGDLEQLCLQYGLTNYNSMSEMCGYCRANRTDMPHTNLQEDAPWRPTRNMSNEVGVAELMDLPDV